MKKKNRNQKTTLGNFYSPYDSGAEGTMSDWYEAYQNDQEKFLVLNEKVYSKIIHRCEFYIYDTPTLLISIEPTESLRVGDILVDERNQEFTIKAFEMLRLAGDVPKWYLKVVNIAIQGKSYSIGNYLSKKCCL